MLHHHWVSVPSVLKEHSVLISRGLEFCELYTPEGEDTQGCNIISQKNGILNHTTVKTSLLAGI
jgi:hypothetical protein